KLAFSRTEHGITLFQNGQSYKFTYLKSDFNGRDEQCTENNLTAPMPGVITQVLVAANDKVKKDDVLLTLEAMKIEYTIRAPHDGIIANSYFQKGDQVKAGDELVEFQPLEIGI
ncbi:3-methylcrotonyl-CoA carboxylase, partial [Corynebacterium diphtheriae]